MAYDDDDGNGKSWDDIVSLWERMLGRDLTINQLIVLTETIERVAGGRGAQDLNVREVAEVLRESKLTQVPVETVAELADVLAPLSGKGDVLEQVTLSHLQRVVGRKLR